jgi:hypothetical protein
MNINSEDFVINSVLSAKSALYNLFNNKYGMSKFWEPNITERYDQYEEELDEISDIKINCHDRLSDFIKVNDSKVELYNDIKELEKEFSDTKAIYNYKLTSNEKIIVKKENSYNTLFNDKRFLRMRDDSLIRMNGMVVNSINMNYKIYFYEDMYKYKKNKGYKIPEYIEVPVSKEGSNDIYRIGDDFFRNIIRTLLQIRLKVDRKAEDKVSDFIMSNVDRNILCEITFIHYPTKTMTILEFVNLIRFIENIVYDD